MRIITGVVLFCLLLAIIVIVRNHFKEDEFISSLKDGNAITRIEMEITCSSGLRRVVISDRRLLDTINRELMGIKEINVLTGGIYDIWANVTLYKKQTKFDFQVRDSPYNGWMIVFIGRALESEYIFHLVKSYCQ